MSFILDALKKSESDRQRQSGPSLFEVKVAPPRRQLPIWAVAIAALLGVNIIVVAWMLLRHPAAQQPGSAPIAAAATAPAAATATPPVATPTAGEAAPSGRANVSSAARTAAPPPADTTPPPAATAPLPAATAPPASSRQPPAAAAVTGRTGKSAGQPPAADESSDDAPAAEPSAAEAAAPEGTGDGGLPLYQQIVTSDGLPALHLDLHVFADSPKDRFVMINMHRLGEGDSLPSGVQVAAIRPDGVVLAYHGTRFLLPRN